METSSPHTGGVWQVVNVLTPRTIIQVGARRSGCLMEECFPTTRQAKRQFPQIPLPKNGVSPLIHLAAAFFAATHSRVASGQTREG